jgi:hypothetical protein
MCPNCGTTISLEKRKKIDFNLIQKATSVQPRSFTKLLHITRLPRKTLALRLKEMCKDNILTKEQGKYMLNGASEYDNNGGKFSKKFSNVLKDRRFRTGLMLIALLIASSTSGYALARFLAPTEIKQEPTIVGKFTMVLTVSEVEDLYSWQAFINFNSSDLKIVRTDSGGFVGVEYPFFLNATDIGEGRLLLGGTLYGNVPGKSTDTPRTLATITFGYYTTDFEEPTLSFTQEGFFKTYLLDSTESFIPLREDTVTLTTAQS